MTRFLGDPDPTGRLRAFRAGLAGQLAAGDVRLDLGELQRLAEETDRLTATGEAIAGEVGGLGGRPPR